MIESQALQKPTLCLRRYDDDNRLESNCYIGLYEQTNDRMIIRNGNGVLSSLSSWSGNTCQNKAYITIGSYVLYTESLGRLHKRLQVVWNAQKHIMVCNLYKVYVFHNKVTIRALGKNNRNIHLYNPEPRKISHPELKLSSDGEHRYYQQCLYIIFPT